MNLPPKITNLTKRLEIGIATLKLSEAVHNIFFDTDDDILAIILNKGVVQEDFYKTIYPLLLKDDQISIRTVI
jgi:hypothetical protein